MIIYLINILKLLLLCINNIVLVLILKNNNNSEQKRREIPRIDYNNEKNKKNKITQ